MTKYAFSRALRLVPFCGKFHLCSRNDFKEAGIELLITTVVSSMPLWLLPLLGPVILNTNVGFTEQLFETITGGELLVFCAALAGPLIYVISRRYGETRSQDSGASGTSKLANKIGFAIAFPHGTEFIFFSAMICVVSGVAFSLMKHPSIHDVKQLNLNGIFWVSIGMYVFSLYCFFWASAYRNAIAPFLAGDAVGQDAVSQGGIEEDAFALEWEKRNAGSN